MFGATGNLPGDSLSNFQKKLSRDIILNMGLPPDSHRGDTCYHYTELIKVEINKYYKVVSIELSDSAPQWIKEDIDRQKKQKDINYKALDSLAMKGGLRNCSLVFPFIIESDDFPCGQEMKKPRLPAEYFQFGGKKLKGNIFFGEEIKYRVPIRHIVKTIIP